MDANDVSGIISRYEDLKRVVGIQHALLKLPPCKRVDALNSDITSFLEPANLKVSMAQQVELYRQECQMKSDLLELKNARIRTLERSIANLTQLLDVSPVRRALRVLVSRKLGPGD